MRSLESVGQRSVSRESSELYSYMHFLRRYGGTGAGSTLAESATDSRDIFRSGEDASLEY